MVNDLRELYTPPAECPFGGDKDDCKECIYYPDFEWNEEKQNCMRRKKEC